MRGSDHQQSRMFSYISAERRVPKDHPLRAIRAMVDVALHNMAPQFDAMYAKMGRPSIAPEKLLRALLLQVLYTVRSERMLMEQLDCAAPIAGRTRHNLARLPRPDALFFITSVAASSGQSLLTGIRGEPVVRTGAPRYPGCWA